MSAVAAPAQGIDNSGAEHGDTELRNHNVEDESDSDSESLNEDTFASFFSAFAAANSDDEEHETTTGGSSGSNGINPGESVKHGSKTQPCTAAERAAAWQKMLAEQDPYVRDQQLQEFSHEEVDVAGVHVNVRHFSGAKHRDLGTGRVVWPIAKRLAQFLANPAQLETLPPHLQAKGSLSVQGKVVLELGSGPGFLSIFAHRLGARHVTMTDQAPLLPLMLMNREDNGVSERNVHVVDLDWCQKKREVFPPLHARASILNSRSDIEENLDADGGTQSPDPDGEFDVILCSDLIYSGYQRDPCTPLAETLNRYIAPTPFYTTVIFAFRERGLLSLEDPVGTVSMFFNQLQEIHGIASQQLHVRGQFGDGEEGYRLFLLWRSKPLAPDVPSPEQRQEQR